MMRRTLGEGMVREVSLKKVGKYVSDVLMLVLIEDGREKDIKNTQVIKESRYIQNIYTKPSSPLLIFIFSPLPYFTPHILLPASLKSSLVRT